METAWRDSRLPVTFLRAGDFIDGAQKGLIMDRVILKQLAKGRIVTLGKPDVRRAYAYLPDLARAAVALTHRTDLPQFADLAFPGHCFSVNEMAAEITRQSGRRLRIAKFPWWSLRLAAPVWELAREMAEMRYLFDHPHSLSGAELAALLPDFQATPFQEVIAGHLPARD